MGYSDESVTFWTIAKYILVWLVALVMLIWVFGSWFTVSPGERAFITTWWKPSWEILSEGLHFKTPLIDSVVKMDVKVQKTEVPNLSSASKDLQDVTTHIAVNYSILPSEVIKVYTTVWNNEAVSEKLINPIIAEVVKSTTAQYTAIELVTMRNNVSNALREWLISKLTKQWVKITDVNIINFSYSKSFSDAIELKVTAEQTALAEKNKLETIKYQAQQKEAQANWVANANLIEAKAEAEAIKIKSQAIVQQWWKEYVELKKIEKWDGVMPKIITWDSSSLFLDVWSQAK